MQIALFRNQIDFFCDTSIRCLIALLVLIVHDQQRGQTALAVIPLFPMVKLYFSFRWRCWHYRLLVTVVFGAACL